MEENWLPVKGYEGLYEISDLGRIKSLCRFVKCRSKGVRINKERILRQILSNHGYLQVGLHGKGVKKTRKIHQLVAESFLNHTTCGLKLVVNHKDLNKTNNNVNNLEIVTNRENCNKKHLKTSSIYTGVCWVKRDKRWMASIVIKGKLKYLGYFTNELEASNAYQKALLELN